MRLHRTRGDHDFVEDCVHRLRGCGVDGAIDGDDASEGADSIAFIGQLVGLGDGGAAGQAAGIVVLYHRHRWLDKVRHRAPGSVRIHQVVIGKLAPVQLRGARDSGKSGGRGGVQGARLVRVFAVAQPGHLVQGDGQALRQLPFDFLRCEIASDCGIVLGHVSKGLGRQPPPVLRRQASVDHLFRDPFVVFGVDDHRHRGKILGGGAQHGRAADVDIFEGVFQGDPRLADGGDEGVEIYSH